MKTIKQYVYLLLAVLMVSSCIERYYPDTELNFVPKLVIEGLLATDDGPQEIVISQSSSTGNPQQNPVSGCTVMVEDKKGNRFLFAETKNKGHYSGVLEGGSIVIGNRYRLHVKTSDGKEYVSSYEELMPCPDVSNIYYELAQKGTTNRDVNENGLQFYVDFKADDTYGRFYRWQLVQTYEYHSTWPLEKWLDKFGYHVLDVPDYSNFVCYKTDKLSDIYVLSTDGFSQNVYKKFRLHFVPDQTQVLRYKYSLLVRQYSLSEKAYNYWANLKENNQENADMFGKQPANVKGNIYNVKDTTETALGYFSISAIRSKRIMVKPINGLSFINVGRCHAAVIEGPTIEDDLPVYYVMDVDYDGFEFLGRTTSECIFCTELGGTTVKPSYWDEK